MITSKELINVIYNLSVPTQGGKKNKLFLFQFWLRRYTYIFIGSCKGGMGAELSLYQLNFNYIAGTASPSKNQYKLGNFLAYNLSLGLTLLMYLRVKIYYDCHCY